MNITRTDKDSPLPVLDYHIKVIISIIKSIARYGLFGLKKNTYTAKAFYEYIGPVGTGPFI